MAADREGERAEGAFQYVSPWRLDHRFSSRARQAG
jgi:hypothetical protein